MKANRCLAHSPSARRFHLRTRRRSRCVGELSLTLGDRHPINQYGETSIRLSIPGLLDPFVRQRAHPGPLLQVSGCPFLIATWVMTIVGSLDTAMHLFGAPTRNTARPLETQLALGSQFLVLTGLRGIIVEGALG